MAGTIEFQTLEDVIAAIKAGLLDCPSEWLDEIQRKAPDAHLRRGELLKQCFAALDDPDPTDLSWALVMWHELHGFLARPYQLLDFEQQLTEPRHFWRVLHLSWIPFLVLPHSRFQAAFARLRAHWDATYMLAEQLRFFERLPDELTIFRGQSREHPIGISWTLDRSVAERYAIGHFSLTNPTPVVIEARVRREEIATVGVDPKESEVVLFSVESAKNCNFLSVGRLSSKS